MHEYFSAGSDIDYPDRDLEIGYINCCRIDHGYIQAVAPDGTPIRAVHDGWDFSGNELFRAEPNVVGTCAACWAEEHDPDNFIACELHGRQRRSDGGCPVCQTPQGRSALARHAERRRSVEAVTAEDAEADDQAHNWAQPKSVAPAVPQQAPAGPPHAGDDRTGDPPSSSDVPVESSPLLFVAAARINIRRAIADGTIRSVVPGEKR